MNALDKAIRMLDRKIYKNVKKMNSKGTIANYGDMSEEDFKGLVKGLKYDRDLDMYFTPKANYAISYDRIVNM